MKFQFYFLVGLLSLSFTSCKLEGKNEASPRIYLSNDGGIIKNGTDSLKLSISAERTAYLMDSIQLGDSVLFKLNVFGGFHGIKLLSIKLSDSTLAELIYQPKDSLDRIFNSQSDYNKGLFVMNGSQAYLHFPFQLYAKKESNDLSLNISVITAASEQFNNASARIKIPIQPAATNNQD